MSWLQAVSRWMEDRKTRKIERHRALGTCPECHGSGFLPFAAGDLGLPVFQEGCYGCDGSGRFDDWEARQQL